MDRPAGDLEHRARSTTLIVAVLLGSLVVGAARPPSAAATPPDPPTPAAAGTPSSAADDVEAAPTPEELAHAAASEELAAARRHLRAAEAELRAARLAATAADAALRRGEEELVPSILAQLDAAADAEATLHRRRAVEQRIRRAGARLESLAVRADEVAIALEDARVELEARVIRAYKTGTLAYESTLPLTLVREAVTPGELAVALRQLSTLMAVGADQVEELVDELLGIEVARERAAVQLSDATRTLEVVVEQLAEAEARREAAGAASAEAEARASRLRATAYAAGARLLAASSAADARQQDLAERTRAADLTAARAGVVPLEEAATGAEDADAPAGPDPGRWELRTRALARGATLPAADRHTAIDWRCPVEGASFINDWGFPRSNGRRHEGTDVFASLGTPVLAPVDAVVADVDAVDRHDGRRDLGGITVTLEYGRHRLYLAHLDTIAADLQVGDEVAAGTVVGTVGRSGNARGTPPHLHLGWYVDRVAVNAYASLAVACSPERPPLDGAGPAPSRSAWPDRS